MATFTKFIRSRPTFLPMPAFFFELTPAISHLRPVFFRILRCPPSIAMCNKTSDVEVMHHFYWSLITVSVGGFHGHVGRVGQKRAKNGLAVEVFGFKSGLYSDLMWP